ncbi:hypothetical protein BpHYR1_025053 [Brachionus plicatilis]|uniref:Uncharacterized protein n=1 Tax=Brachionus plicatilis TaxID=10195 RepID=A0A3M7SE99_BRAPC|nr:hypothetical protein BpHYR1_025053 [Brachionus plicatilis]
MLYWDNRNLKRKITIRHLFDYQYLIVKDDCSLALIDAVFSFIRKKGCKFGFLQPLLEKSKRPGPVFVQNTFWNRVWVRLEKLIKHVEALSKLFQKNKNVLNLNFVYVSKKKNFVSLFESAFKRAELENLGDLVSNDNSNTNIDKIDFKFQKRNQVKFQFKDKHFWPVCLQQKCKKEMPTDN